jgi:hypothetical protein
VSVSAPLRLRPSPLPWSKPKHELLLLVLVGAIVLSPVGPTNVQDYSRLCLTRALVHARLTIDGCIGGTVDRSKYRGHYYSDKAPGYSILAVPSAEAAGVFRHHWVGDGEVRIWVVRVFTSGLAFLACAFLVGRIGEGLAPGWGGLALAAFGLGTLAGPFASATFDQMPAAAFGFGAFVLAWARRPLLAGLALGAALTLEYESIFFLAAVGAYVAVGGLRPLVRLALATVPGIAVACAYDWLAFGAPWHTPLRYVDNVYRAQERRGILGVHVPSLHGIGLVLVGSRGLLVISPVVLAGAAGLWLLWRRGFGAEALVCGGVVVMFTLANCGYFLPYGGVSPGPRFLVPSLPFLALGFAPAFAAFPRVAAVLTAFSVIPITALTLVWQGSGEYRQTIWGEMVRVATQRGHSRLVQNLEKNIIDYAYQPRVVAAAIVSAAALSTLLAALWTSPLRRGAAAEVA